ncbi:MAG: pyridoxamine 5'-phosphate oxidase family protein [Alphaproteobacteria bacterium]
MADEPLDLARAILAQGRDLAIATLRPDGFPQATTVSYVADGLTIYFGCGEHSQKARNIARDARVSLTLTLDYDDWTGIRGLSLAGLAERVTDPAEVGHIGKLMMARFPQVADLDPPWEGDIAFIRVMPKVISVLDYRKGFGHTDLVALPG